MRSIINANWTDKMMLASNVLETELRYFDNFFKKAISSSVPLLKDIMEYLYKNKGKQIRPLFSLLCSKMGGELNETSYCAASIVEMLHTASLLHDDVLDKSMERRGVQSINAIWQNKSAVKAGDCLSLTALLMTFPNENYNILEIYASAINEIVNGEIIQLKKTLKLNMDEQTYFEIIKAKTAAFFAAACAAGAASTFSDKNEIDKFHLFGEHLGMAFQIKDDLLDYGSSNIGKPVGNDIRDKKITLPLIYALKNVNPKLRKKILQIMKQKNKDSDSINFVIAEVEKVGGLDYARKKMTFYRDEALMILNKFPDSQTRVALEDLVRYTTDRTY